MKRYVSEQWRLRGRGGAWTESRGRLCRVCQTENAPLRSTPPAFGPLVATGARGFDEPPADGPSTHVTF